MKVQYEEEYPVLSHLAELRNRIIVSVFCIIVFSSFFYIQSPKVILWLQQPLRNFHIEFVFFVATEAFFTRMKLALILGGCFSAPVVLYQVFAFIQPGLTKRERKLCLHLLFSLFPSFVLGVLSGYFLWLPRVVYLIITFGNHYLQASISASNYLSFVSVSILFSGALTTIPILLIYMSYLGWLHSGLLRKGRKWIYIIIMTAASMMVSDLVSILLLILPFILLYEISIVFTVFFEKRKIKEMIE